jgi:hypothetical protein
LPSEARASSAPRRLKLRCVPQDPRTGPGHPGRASHQRGMRPKTRRRPARNAQSKGDTL